MIYDSVNKSAANSTYKKLAVKWSAGTFVVHGSLVLRNYIRGERRQLLVAANRYRQWQKTLVNH
jgi:ribosomal protein L27